MRPRRNSSGSDVGVSYSIPSTFPTANPNIDAYDGRWLLYGARFFKPVRAGRFKPFSCFGVKLLC